MTTNLMYNPGNEALMSRAILHNLPVPAPQGPRHRPIGFGPYADEVVEALNLNGLRTVQEEYAVSNDGNRMFGVLEVEPLEGELITADDWKLLVGVRGSHDQKISRGLTLGSQILVCSNLCFSGNLGTFHTKQTTNIWSRLPGLIGEAVKRIPEAAQRQELEFNRFKEVELIPRHGDAALVELYRREAMTAAQLGHAIQEWDTPSHVEHAEHGHSLWRLHNAFTESLKPTGQTVNMQTISERTEVGSQFLREVAGF